MVTGINSEDRLVQATFAEYLEQELGWDSIFDWTDRSTLGIRASVPPA
jgi:type I restriction enzyme R subunit